MADVNPNDPYEVYNLKGVKVGDNIEALAPGMYILRQGEVSKKFAVN